MKPESTLARLMKNWGGVAQADAQPEALAALQAEFDQFKVSAEANITELSAALEVAVASLKEVEASRDELSEKLSAIEVQVAADAEAAAVAVMTARKDKIVAAVGTDRAGAVFAATEHLDATAFDTVLAAMTVAGTTESKSKMFTEQGASAEADATAVAAGPSKEMQILQNKYARNGAR